MKLHVELSEFYPANTGFTTNLSATFSEILVT